MNKVSKRVDNHNHILNADITEMVAAAKHHNLNQFSITEHVSQFRPIRDRIKFGSMHYNGRIFNNLKEYNEEFQKVKDQTKDLKINCGLEVDFSPRYDKQVGEFVNQVDWDILLCSVHELANRKDVETNTSLSHDALAIRWKEYFQLQKRALESDFIPFKILAHPVRMSRGIVQVPNNFDELLFDLAITAHGRGKMLELNGNDITYAPHLVRRLAHACSKTHCKVSLGSDAHHPNEVFRNIETALNLVDEFRLEYY